MYVHNCIQGSREGGREREREINLIPCVGGHREESSQLLSMFDSQAVLDVEHSLFPVCVACLRCWWERE